MSDEVQVHLPPELVLGEYCNYIQIRQDGGEVLVDLMLVNHTARQGEVIFRMRCDPKLLAGLHEYLGRVIQKKDAPTLQLVDVGDGHQTVVLVPNPKKKDEES